MSHTKSLWQPLEVGNRNNTLPELIHDLPLKEWADQKICTFLQKSASCGTRTRCEMRVKSASSVVDSGMRISITGVIFSLCSQSYQNTWNRIPSKNSWTSNKWHWELPPRFYCVAINAKSALWIFNRVVETQTLNWALKNFDSHIQYHWQIEWKCAPWEININSTYKSYCCWIQFGETCP